MYEYQDRVVEQVRHMKHVLLCLDTGLGKTKISIESLKGVSRASVVCPAFLIRTWQKEIEKWGDGTTEFDVVSYDKMLSAKHRNFLVFDEWHYCRNTSSQRTKRAVALIRESMKAICLTATPIIRSAEDLYPFLKAVGSDFNDEGIKNVTQFRQGYCVGTYSPFARNIVYSGIKEDKKDDFRNLVKPYIIRLSKKDVALEIPEKTVVDYFVKTKVKSTKEERDTFLRLLREVPIEKLASHYAGQRQLLALDKIVAVSQWIQGQVETEPVIVFGWHKLVLERLASHLGENSTVALLTGDTPIHHRDRIVEDFQDGKIKTLLCSIAATGVGLTLTAACKAMFIELPWTYAELKQCEDRLHRIGQEQPVTIFYCLSDHYIDQNIERILGAKRKLMSVIEEAKDGNGIPGSTHSDVHHTV